MTFALLIFLLRWQKIGFSSVFFSVQQHSTHNQHTNCIIVDTQSRTPYKFSLLGEVHCSCILASSGCLPFAYPIYYIVGELGA